MPRKAVATESPLRYIESNDGYYSDSIHERECNGQIETGKSQGSQESLVTGRIAGMKLAESLYCIEVLGSLGKSCHNYGAQRNPFTCQQHHDGDLFNSREKDQIHVFPQIRSIFSPRSPCAERIRILSQVATGGVLGKQGFTNTSVSRQGSTRLQLATMQ